MAEWKLVPSTALPELVAAWWRQKNTGADTSDYAAYTAMLAATPPMPRAEWEQMVERAARALCAAFRAYVDCACGKREVCVSCQLDAEAALRAALPGLRVEGDQEDRT